MTPEMVAAQAMALAQADVESFAGTRTFARVNQSRFRWDKNEFRCQLMQGTLDVADRETGPFVEPMPNETWEEAASKPGRLPMNPLPNWLDKWCATYNNEPERTFYYKGVQVADDSPQAKVVDALLGYYQQVSINEVMADTDRKLRLVGNHVLVPFYDADNDELVCQRYPSPNVRVVENHINPARPYATVVRGTVDELGSDGYYAKKHAARVWVTVPGQPVEFFSVLAGNKSPTEKRKYSPVVHCFEQAPTNLTGYFVRSPGPWLAQLVVLLQNDWWAPTGFMVVMQNFGVGQIFGAAPGTKPAIGPNQWLEFKGDPDRREGVEFAKPQPEIQATLETIDKILMTIRQDFGIPESMFDVQVDASGAAIIAANGPMAEQREARLKTFRPIETRFLRAVLGELAEMNAPGFAGVNPDDWDVSVAFAKSQASLSVQDQIALDKHYIELGAMEPAEVLMRRHPDRFNNIDEARVALVKVKTPEPEEAEAMAGNDSLDNDVEDVEDEQ